MQKLTIFVLILGLIGVIQSHKIENYLKKNPIRVRIRNTDIDDFDVKNLRERNTDLLRREREDDPDVEVRTKVGDLHRREIDPRQVMRERDENMRKTNDILLRDVEVHLRTYINLADVDYGNDVVRSPREEWLTITRMDDEVGGYTIRSEDKLFVPYSMAGYRTTVSPLEEMLDDNNRWNITWTSDTTIRLSLGPKRMMKERYPTVNDHHVAPTTLGDLYASQTEYLWSYGEERGRRAEFTLEMHPDLVVEMGLTMPKQVTTKKDCEKLKKHKDCIYRSRCRWVNNKCQLVEDSEEEPMEN